MQLTNQKRLAAKILGCGVHRVWINSDYIDMVASAVQTEDIREFIDQGIIKAKPVKGTSRARARVRLEQKRKGRRKGQGKRQGTANARNPRKNRWMRTIRAQRRVLKELRTDGNPRRRRLPPLLPEGQGRFLPIHCAHAHPDGRRRRPIQGE